MAFRAVIEGMRADGTLCLDCRRLPDGERVPPAEIRRWARVLRCREHEGREVTVLRLLFRTEEAASRNYQALAFVELESWYVAAGERRRYVPAEGELQLQVGADPGIAPRD